jgi:hypothetical protein
MNACRGTGREGIRPHGEPLRQIGLGFGYSWIRLVLPNCRSQNEETHEMAMAYYHWAAEPVVLHEISYPQSGHPKPNGLWFDVNGGWKRWCTATDFRPETFQYRHTVTVLDKSKILFLRSARDIDAFTGEYGKNLSIHIQFLQSPEEMGSFAQSYGRDLFSEIQKQFANYIMWGDVAEKHSGIIIAPYSRTRSETYLWYHGWNCAGGCIWDLNAVRLGTPCRQA